MPPRGSRRSPTRRTISSSFSPAASEATRTTPSKWCFITRWPTSSRRGRPGADACRAWFSEGLASVAERSWGIGNRSRFLWATVMAGQPTVTTLEGLFHQDASDVARAYIIAHAIVRDVIRRHGAAVVPRILSGVAAGATFDNAFLNATGTTVRGATRLFWRSSGGWEEWITFLASPFTLWTLITSLALAAIWRHRLRRAERRRRWEAEEALDADPWDEHRPDYRVH